MVQFCTVRWKTLVCSLFTRMHNTHPPKLNCTQVDARLSITPKLAQMIDLPLFNFKHHTLKKKKDIFPHIQGNSDGSVCKVIYEEGLPNL
jgi:hypothetical protein